MKERCRLVSRRQFITGLGATVSLGVVGGYAIGVWRNDPGATIASPSTTAVTTTTAATAGTFGQPLGPKTLVIVEMGGGNEAPSSGVTMVSPPVVGVAGVSWA